MNFLNNKKKKSQKNILVIAAHPDDDALGCGGTLAKLSKQNYNIFAMYFTDGVSSRDDKHNLKKKIIDRKKNSLKAAKILGIKKCFFYSYEDNKLDSVSLLEIVKKIEEVINATNPEILMTHFENDLNVDHQIINRATITASRPKPRSKIKKILLFETLSSSEWNFSKLKKKFDPNYFVDISKTLNTKIKAIKCYKSEILKWPHPRSIKGVKNLAMYRGQTVGKKFAEGFYMLREISC